jgi:RHS repeat-associated protein
MPIVSEMRVQSAVESRPVSRWELASNLPLKLADELHFRPYNRMQMHLSSGTQIPDGLLAAMTLRNENSRLGVPSQNHALHRGFDSSKTQSAIGLQTLVSTTRIRSCSTGKERDAESGNDYFGARYYASSMGRWMSPDWSKTPTGVPYVDLTNPQTLNLYQYMRNNPLSGADPDGHCDWCQKVWNKITGNGWKTDAQLGVSTQQGDGYVTPASNADTGGDYGTSTMTVDPTGGMSVTVGGSVGPGGASVSYTPGTGEVDQTTSVGPMGVGGSVSVSSSAPASGTSATVSGYYGVGGSASITSTGETSTSVGLGTPGVGASVDSTTKLGSVPPVSMTITMPNIAPQNAACGGGICMEDDHSLYAPN